MEGNKFWQPSKKSWAAKYKLAAKSICSTGCGQRRVSRLILVWPEGIVAAF